MLPSIFDYLDYRTWLRDTFAAQKRVDRTFGYRKVAPALGLKSPGHITWILQGKRNLTHKSAECLCEVFHLGPSELQWLELLVAHNDCHEPLERIRLFRRIANGLHGKRRILAQSQVAYWSHWLNPVVRELAAIAPELTVDPEALGKRVVPAVSRKEAEQALQMLELIGLLEKQGDGTLVRKDKVLSAGEDWNVEAVRLFQSSLLSLAQQALFEIPKEERDISTVTFSVSKKTLAAIRKRASEFRQEVITLARTDHDPECVYHLALQLFPAST